MWNVTIRRTPRADREYSKVYHLDVTRSLRFMSNIISILARRLRNGMARGTILASQTNILCFPDS
jgi:hypothetical protein